MALPLASAVAGHPYTDEDLLWLRQAAGSYVVEATEAGRSVYRLYHQALADHLQENVDRFTVETSFTDVLLSRVPRNIDGRKNWERAHPYIRNYLVSHAAACDKIDPLILDPGFQLAAAQPELLAHLPDAQSDEAIAAAAVYQRAAHHLRDRPAEDHASYLELAARRVHADAFADSISHIVPHRAWSAQWANWQSETPHVVLARHAEGVVGVACISIVDGWRCAVSLGRDYSAQTIDLIHRQPIVMPWEDANGVIVMVGSISSVDSRPFVITVILGSGLILWDVSDNRNVKAIRLANSFEDFDIVNFAELADQRTVAVFINSDGTIRAQDVVTGKDVGPAIQNFAGTEHRLGMATSASLPDGRVVVVTANKDSPVRAWDLLTGEPSGVPITGHHGEITALDCVQVPDGRTMVLTGGDDGAVRVWDLATGEPAYTPLSGHIDRTGALDCALLPDGRAIAITGADDGIIRTWDLATGQMIGGAISGHPGSVAAISHTNLQDGRTVIVSGGNDGTVRMWDLPSENAPARTPVHPGRILSMTLGHVANTHDAVIGGLMDGTLRVWDLNNGQALNEPILAHSEVIWAVTYAQTPDGEDIAISASMDGTARIWDLNTGQAVGLFPRPPDMTFSLACAHLPDGRTAVITGGSDPVMRIWDLETGSEISRVRTHRKGPNGRQRSWLEITAIASTSLPDGRRVAVTGHGTGTIRVWDLTTGQRVGVPMVSRDPGQPSNAQISAIACTRLPDGRVVAVTGSEDTTRSRVRAWDLSTGRLLARSYVQTSWVRAACSALLPSGRTVAITGDDVLRIWDLDGIGYPDTENDWAPVKEIDLDAPVNALVAGPDFSIIAGTEHGIAGLTLH